MMRATQFAVLALSIALPCYIAGRIGFEHALMLPDLHEGMPCVNIGVCIQSDLAKIRFIRVNADPDTKCAVVKGKAELSNGAIGIHDFMVANCDIGFMVD